MRCRTLCPILISTGSTQRTELACELYRDQYTCNQCTTRQMKSWLLPVSTLRKRLREERQLSTPMAQAASPWPKGNGQQQIAGQLGPLLCWAVVFADIGSSIYYLPGLLLGRGGNPAGFFVLLTHSVFFLLTLLVCEM